MADMLGYEPDEMLGRRVDSFMFPEDLGDHSNKMEARTHGQESVYERQFLRKNGEALWTIVSACPLQDEQGNFAGSFAMFTNITKRKQAENALRETLPVLLPRRWDFLWRGLTASAWREAFMTSGKCPSRRRYWSSR